MTINFVTTNPGKVKAMTEHLAGLAIEVRQVSLDLIEPQADTVEEVALSKARQAFKQLKRPVVVEDSAFCIDELHGFPGPYIKYVLETVGIDGILQLASRLKSRRCHFVSALAYIDARGIPEIFVERGKDGQLATVSARENTEEAWSELWRIFIPHGAKNPLSALTQEEREAVWDSWRKQSKFVEFGQWHKRQESAG